MKKRLWMSVAAAALLSSSFTVCAAPQYMADGAVFDPEWYLEQYPDVKAGWQLGTSADAVYEHYVRFGAGENRQPYDAAALDMTNILPYQNQDPAAVTQPDAQTQPAAPQEPSAASRIVMAVEGETYQFPTIHTEEYDNADCVVNISFEKELMDEYSYIPENLEAYALPGYEWRIIDVLTSAEGSVTVADSLDMAAILAPYHDYYCVNYCVNDFDGSYSGNYNELWEDIGDWTTHVADFTITQNGTDYTGCKIFVQKEGNINEYCNETWYALVPENFSGSLPIGYTGCKLENGTPVEDTSASIISFSF